MGPAPFMSRFLRSTVAVGVGALAVVGCGSEGDSIVPARDAATTKAVTSRPPTTVTRWPQRRGRSGIAPVKVEFSRPLVADSPRPRLSPHVAGTWSTSGRVQTFTPASTMMPCTSYRLTVPTGTTAEGADSLAHARTAHLDVACPGVRAAQNALSRLHYLPTRVVGSGRTALPPSGPVTRRQVASQVFRPTGRLVPRYQGAPKVTKGQKTPAFQGAVMAFQHRVGLEVDGLMGSATWRSLLAAEASDRRAKGPYTWVTVKKGGSESLTVHRAGKVTLTSAANTGVAGAESDSGSFPIFQHTESSDMRGTNPDGSQYNDPDVPWVNYYNGGEAVHGFRRASYGSSQSAGCVELPIPTAKKVFGMLDIGDIVTVSNGG